MNQKCRAGFSLLEVMLALVVITVAGMGAYSLFDSGLKSHNMTDVADEAVQIANVYTDLVSSDLTSAVATEKDLVTLLQSSGRLPQKYFATTTTGTKINPTNTPAMVSPFGALTFTSADPYSFTVSVPLGKLAADSSAPAEFFKKLRDVYSCPVGSATPECCQTATTSPCTLYFTINN